MLTLNILMQSNNGIYIKKTTKRTDSYLVNVVSRMIRKKAKKKIPEINNQTRTVLISLIESGDIENIH